MGTGNAHLVLRKQGLALVGAYGRRAERSGLDLGHAMGLGWDLGIRIGADLDAVIRQGRPHVAIQATCPRLADAAEEISILVGYGVHVISFAEERVLDAPPGLYSMADRPVPAAILGDARQLRGAPAWPS